MTIAEIEQYLLAKPETTLSYPFGPDVKVFKVNNKMFALLGFHNDKDMLNLKCDPLEASAMCDIYACITPGYHMDKRHWISVYQTGEISDGEQRRLIDNSFHLVVSNMPKRDQARLLSD